MTTLAQTVEDFIKSKFDLEDIEIHLSSTEDEWELQEDCVVISIPEINLRSLKFGIEEVIENGKTHVVRGVYIKYNLLTDECYFMRRVFTKQEIQAKYIHSHVAKNKFSFNWLEYSSINLCFGDTPFGLIGSLGEKIVYFYNHIKLMFSYEHDEDVISYPKLRHIEEEYINHVTINYKKKYFDFDKYKIFIDFDRISYQIDYNIIDGFIFKIDEEEVLNILESNEVFNIYKVLLFANRYYNTIEEIKSSTYNLQHYNTFKFKGEEVKVKVLNDKISEDEVTTVFHPDLIDSTLIHIQNYINEKTRSFNNNFSQKIIEEFTSFTDR